MGIMATKERHNGSNVELSDSTEIDKETVENERDTVEIERDNLQSQISNYKMIIEKAKKAKKWIYEANAQNDLGMICIIRSQCLV